MGPALKTLVVTTLALTLCSPAYATFPGGNGRIAFVSSAEIWVVYPDGSGLGRLTDNSAADREPVWSPVFAPAKIAFASDRDGNGNHEIYVMNPSGSGQTRLTVTAPGDDSREPAWSADGDRIIFTRYFAGGCSTLMTMRADGSDLTPLDPTPYCERFADAAFTPDGQRIAFATRPIGAGFFYLYTVSPDGAGAQQLAGSLSGRPHWSPGAIWLAVGDRVLTPSGQSTEFMVPYGAKWSPDGSWLLRAGSDPEGDDIEITNERGGEATSPASFVGPDAAPDWQPLGVEILQPTHPHAKSAARLQFPLVPAYRECTAPDRTHGPPLVFGSCSSPTPASDYLTVGTPDANGQPVKSTGYVRVNVLPGDPGAPGDQADVRVTVDLNDVRCRTTTYPCPDGALSDYEGVLQAIMPMTITDRFNSGRGNQPATADTLSRIRIPIPCTPTTDPDAGSRCAVQTTIEAVFPDAVREGKRAVWNVQQIEITDGGASGDPTTSDYTLFAVPGVFVP